MRQSCRKDWTHRAIHVCLGVDERNAKRARSHPQGRYLKDHTNLKRHQNGPERKGISEHPSTVHLHSAVCTSLTAELHSMQNKLTWSTSALPKYIGHSRLRPICPAPFVTRHRPLPTCGVPRPRAPYSLEPDSAMQEHICTYNYHL